MNETYEESQERADDEAEYADAMRREEEYQEYLWERAEGIQREEDEQNEREASIERDATARGEYV